MLIIDLSFTYKNNIRYLIINKLGLIKNTYDNLFIRKLLFFFYFTKLEDLDSSELFNMFYLLKYFFGWNAFFSKTKMKFSLNKWYYSLNIRFILNKDKDIHKILFVILNNILCKMDKSFIKNGIFSKKYNIFYYTLNDLSRFSELKTNLGLIYLNKPLNILIYLNKDYSKDKLINNNNILLLTSLKYFS